MARLFFSYSHADENLRDRLEKSLAMLKYEGLIESWHDRCIPAGDAFDHLLAAIGAGSDENSVRTELAERMQVSAELVEALILRLFKLNLIERFDPTSDRFTRFDRQLLLLDALVRSVPVEPRTSATSGGRTSHDPRTRWHLTADRPFAGSGRCGCPGLSGW